MGTGAGSYFFDSAFSCVAVEVSEAATLEITEKSLTPVELDLFVKF